MLPVCLGTVKDLISQKQDHQNEERVPDYLVESLKGNDVMESKLKAKNCCVVNSCFDLVWSRQQRLQQKNKNNRFMDRLSTKFTR